MNDLHFIFVYGTLKRGQCRAIALDGQTFVQTANTEPVYRMFNVGTFPGLIDDPNGIAIHGEIWQVTTECLARLDEIEGTDVGLYARHPISLQNVEHKTEAWFYLGETTALPDCGSIWE